MLPIVFMFSGQGSQYYKMGLELFEQLPSFRRWMLYLDNFVYNIMGESIIEQVYNKEKRKLDLFDTILYTHPAIFMLEYALSKVLLENGIFPDYILGTSMGEFASNCVAGVCDLEESLENVMKQANILALKAQDGGMMAVLSNISLFETISTLFNDIELASINFDSHFVISGRKDTLLNVSSFLKEKDINHQLLPVSYAFHSSLIDNACVYYKNYLKHKIFNVPKIPIISCSKSVILNSLPDGYFWEVIRKPVQFKKTIHMLEEKGNYLYLDLGPSGTLATFTKYNIRKESQSKSYATVTPYGKGLKNLEKIISLCKALRA